MRAPHALRALASWLLASIALLLNACSGSPAGAPEPAHAELGAADDADERGAFLWEVIGDGKPSYFYGTIHIGFSAEKELPEHVWKHLEGASTFAMEANPSDDPAGQIKAATLPPDESLEEILGSEDWSQLLALAEMPESMLKRFRPWLAYSLVMRKLYPGKPLDTALQDRATALEKEMIYLEDWRLQVALLNKVVGADDLREVLRDDGAGRATLERMLAAYRAGDFREIHRITFDPEEMEPEMREEMLSARNRAWVKTLRDRLHSGGLFVAVGVGHFPGEDGLIELLRGEGFIVRRVP